MKIFFRKISFLLLSVLLITSACETEETLVITTPEATFELQQPSISSIFLNFSLPNNPAFTISWNDEVTGSNSYTVEMSTDAEFTTAINLGNTDTSSFSMTVSELNTAIRNTGITTFRDIAVYMRVNAGSQVSNSILYLVTTYPDPMQPPTFTGISNGDAFVLNINNNSDVAVTFEWEDAILSSSLSLDVNYYLEAATAGTDFATVIEAAPVSVNNSSIPLTHSQLNNIAIESGIAIEATGDVDFRVRSVITDANTGAVLERTSETLTISITTYLTVLDLSTEWGVVGSAANNWGATPDLPFFETETDGVIAAYVHLTNGEIKIRQNNSWDAPNVNYGDATGDGILDTDSNNNIAVTEGDYKITMNLNTLAYTIEPFSLGIVGSAFNDWGATPDFMLQYDQYSDVFRGIVTLLDGEMKFRMNNDWNQDNWGDATSDGVLDMDSNNNINITAGIYIATVNLNTLEYSLEPIDYVWGLVGSAFNDWGATPDAVFSRDWSKPFNDAWILENVTLLDGEFKIRANEDWNLPNYGDATGDGILDQDGGNNIASTAGNYTIELDFTDPNAPTIKITQL